MVGGSASRIRYASRRREGAMNAKKLGGLDVLDADGSTVRLGDFWKDRPVVLVFIRHFG